MDVGALRYFIATAQFGSITQAAAHLHVAQPAVSRQIRKLERDLGVRLLQRTTRGVLLTEQGAHLLARAAPIVRALTETRSEVRNWDREPAGPVAVALMPAVGSLVAPILVRRLRDEHRKVELRLSEGLSASIGDGVMSGQFDLGLFHTDQTMPALAITHLLDEPMFLIGPGGEAGGTGRPVSIKDLPQYPLLLPGPPHTLRRMMERLAEDRGVALDIREPVDSTSIIKRLVAAGLGYTVQCYSFVHEEVQRGDLSIRRLDIESLARNWSLASRADRPRTSAASAVATIICEIADHLAKTHRWQPPGR